VAVVTCHESNQQKLGLLEGNKTVSLGREIYPNLKLRIYTTGIRQNRLARMLGIDEAHLSRIINGFRQPSGDIREQIATILQSDPEWLFHRMHVSDESLSTDTNNEEALKHLSNH
jgi:transcriptional regulator with XRE-family HTH domain